jgi:hypothetical protein
MKARKGSVGSSFDDYLKEEGIYEEVTEHAMERVLARQLDAVNLARARRRRAARGPRATRGTHRPRSTHS